VLVRKKMREGWLEERLDLSSERRPEKSEWAGDRMFLRLL